MGSRARRFNLLRSPIPVIPNAATGLEAYRTAGAGSDAADEFLGVAADFAAVEHVDHPQLLHLLVAEGSQGNVNQLFLVAPCQSPPSTPGGQRGEQCDFATTRMEAGRGDQSFLQCFGVVEPRIGPDVRDRGGGKQEHGTAVDPQSNARADHFFLKIRRVQRQRGLLVVFREPSRSPRVIAWIGRGIEQHHAGVELPAARRNDLHVDLFFVPVAQRVADVDPILDAGGEFFRSRQIIAKDCLGPIKDPRPKILDPLVFRRITALSVRIPLVLPLLLLVIAGSSLQLERAPGDRRAR